MYFLILFGYVKLNFSNLPSDDVCLNGALLIDEFAVRNLIDIPRGKKFGDINICSL